MRTVLTSVMMGLGVPLGLAFAYHNTMNLNFFWFFLVMVNLMVVALMGKDKFAAQRGWTRTPEFTLLLMAFCGGTPGLLFGKQMFKHKTSKKEFNYKLVAVVALQLGMIVYFWREIARVLSV